MSRFASIDMSALPQLALLHTLGFEDELAELKADILTRAAGRGLDLSDVINLESDPLHIILEALVARVVRLYGEGNDQINGLTLAGASGPELDHIAATYFGIARLTVTAADDTSIPPQDAVLEDDASFRARIALAPEAFSTAGSRGAYIFHTLELDGVADIADVAVYSEDDGATYSAGLHADAFSAGLRTSAYSGRGTGNPVLAPEVLIVILPSTSYGPSDQALLNRAFAACNRDDVRPLTDSLRVEPAIVQTYEVEAKLYFDTGPSSAAVVAEAMKNLDAYVASRRRIGARVQRIGIAAALKIAGVQEIDLIKPATDIQPGSKGVAELSGTPVITTEVLIDGWRP